MYVHLVCGAKTKRIRHLFFNNPFKASKSCVHFVKKLAFLAKDHFIFALVIHMSKMHLGLQKATLLSFSECISKVNTMQFTDYLLFGKIKWCNSIGFNPKNYTNENQPIAGFSLPAFSTLIHNFSPNF